MLTSIYYQNLYTSKYINENKNTSYVKSKSTLAYSQNKTQTVDYFLNKASNNTNKSYISELSTSLNNVRTSCYDIGKKIGDELAFCELPKDLEKFSGTYNKFLDFMKQNQKKGKNLDNIFDKIKDCVNQNKDMLSDIGIEITEDDFMVVSGINTDNISENMSSFMSELYDSVYDFMKTPMSDYMDFKDLSSYYTYACGYDKSNSLTLIEQGILVDILL